MTQPTPDTWLDAFFGAGYSFIVNGATVFPKRLRLDLEGVGFTVTDDATNNQTVVTFTNGQTTTLTTASFVMPAVASDVTIPVQSTASLAAGLTVFVAGAGYLTVVSVTDGTHFVAQNTGASGNVSPGSTVATGALVIPAGPAASGGVGSATLGASFVQPAVWQTSGETTTVTVSLSPNSNAYQAGACVCIPGGGFYIVTAIPDGTHATLGNLGLAGAASPGATVGAGVLVMLTGAPAPFIEVGGSAVPQRRILDFEGFTTVDDAAGDRTKIVNSAAQVTTTATFAQPAIGASVNAAVSSSSGYAAGAWVTIAGGGRYTVSAVPDSTHLTIVNRGGTGNASPTTNVASGAIVSLAATEPLELLASVSPFSLRPVNNIAAPEFGAKGVSGPVDRAAIIAADAAAVVNGFPVYFPPGVWLTDQPLTPSPGVTWMGEDASPGTSIIRASVAIAAVVVIHNTDATDATVTTKRNLLRNLTFDAAGLATHAVLDEGSFLTRWECCTFQNAIVDGERAVRNRTAGVLSSVTATVPGGSPAGVTVSQPDPTFILVSQSPGSVNHLVLKVGGTGTNFALSYDNGVTFQPYAQRLTPGASVNLLFVSSVNALGPTGIRVTFPAGTYHDNDTYAFSATQPTEDGGAPTSINTDNRYIDCNWEYNGTCIGTAGALGHFADQPRLVPCSGTATVTSGSTIIDFVGASLMSLSPAPREGDFLQIGGVAFGLVAIADDNRAIVSYQGTPGFSGSGLDYAFLVGAGRHEDANQENDRCQFYNGRSRHNTTDFRFAGQHGPMVIEQRNELFAVMSYAFGSHLQQMQGSALLEAPHIEAGDVNSEAIYVWPGTSPVKVTEPPEHWNYPSSAAFGMQRLLLQGNEFAIAGGASTSVPIYAERYIVTAVVVGSAGFQFAVPTFTLIGQSTDIQFASTANFTSTAAPLFNGLSGLPDGTILQLTNNGFFWLVLRHDVFSSSGLLLSGPYVTIGGGGGWIRFRVMSGKAIEIARWNPYGASHGNDGALAPNMVVTSNATATLLYDFDCVLPGLSAGTTVEWDLIAQSQDGTNNASWLGWRAQISRTGTTAVVTAVIAGTTIIDPGATALGWAMTWGLDAFNQIFKIFGAGDTSGNPVTWKLLPRPLSAGT